MTSFSCIVIGNETLAIQCADMLAERGHRVRAFVTRSDALARLAAERGLRVVRQGPGEAEALAGSEADWLLSIANLRVVPAEVLALAREGAVNFHDGPLPRYAGLNAPVWALLAGEARHAVTWHLMEGGIDEGDILVQEPVEIAPSETAMTLNAKCYAAALASFPALMEALEAGAEARRAQDLSERSYFGLGHQPAAGGLVDPAGAPEAALRTVRALDFGTYPNPVALPKLRIGERVLRVGGAEPAGGEGAPGTVIAADDEGLTLAMDGGAVRLTGLTDLTGRAVRPSDLVSQGDLLEAPSVRADALRELARAENVWRERLARGAPIGLRLAARASGQAPALREIEVAAPDMPEARRRAATLAWALRCAGEAAGDAAFSDPRVLAADAGAEGLVAGHVPLGAALSDELDAAAEALAGKIAALDRAPAFAADLALRVPGADPQIPAIGIAEGGAPHVAGTAACARMDGRVRLSYDASRLTDEAAGLLAARLSHMLGAAASARGSDPLSALPALPEAEREMLLRGWSRTRTAYDADMTVHRAFEAQVDRTPQAQALVFEDETLSYAELDARASRIANALAAMGVGLGDRVGLHLPRSPDMVAAALGIMKAGAAYVPLDPAYPADRIAIYVEDSGASVIVTHSRIAGSLPASQAETLALDADLRVMQAPETRPGDAADGSALAYLIFTSGSTGRPKGVMIEHRNVANFFAGMDDRIEVGGGSEDGSEGGAGHGGTWLALTSLSFDISVLELFYTLSRGFRVVLMGEEERALASSGRLPLTERGMEFSLFYWGNDDGVGPKKYELLLEGAKIADANGFCALWTPERHFHAFGGPYPNPSVTGAAVAAVTKNLEVRAGSCVAPLHHPARIAEEWAVIDNLTNGRTGLAIASGWQPDDFVLRPENAPPANKPAMYEAIDTLRALWRGEPVAFPKADGTPHEVVTQPRPVSKELKIWVTTAGNPKTWIEAGQIGANVLTHLLGQSVDEVAAKIELYHGALREAGRDPADHTVTLMLHTYLAATREEARAVAREPMKDYLRSAAALIKQYAWAFPAFKRPEGAASAMDIDLGGLEPDELEGILDFAFERYFNDSGLFGTVGDALARVEALKRIGVDEIACLIDYGIAPEMVLDGLEPLSRLRAAANMTGQIDPGDFSIAAQILRHGVTHMQCTPSMARMICMNDEARTTLSRLSQLCVGGEALPGALARELMAATRAHIENMYGPTETTIWSSTSTVTGEPGIQDIGRPIANTALYVLGDDGAPVPAGVPGELCIGGDGVARGYWRREDLTAERFPPDPFAGGGARMYRTGDLAAWRADGRLDFIGRADDQVKIRGHRIELGEIEAVVAAQPGVRDCAVLAREDVPGDVRLVAYVTADGPLEPQAVRDGAAAVLPAFMTPAHVVELDAFPLTPNRKIDRKALPAPADAAAPHEAEAPGQGRPEGEIEAAIAAIWQRILGVGALGARANFFELGGHSLLAVQAHRDIRRELGAETLSITDIFRFPTLAELSEHIRGAAGPGAGPGAEEGAREARETARAEARSDAMSRRRAMRARRNRADA